MVWELVPHEAGIPTTGIRDLMRALYPERSRFSGNCNVGFVIADGSEGFVQSWVCFFVWDELRQKSVMGIMRMDCGVALTAYLVPPGR